MSVNIFAQKKKNGLLNQSLNTRPNMSYSPSQYGSNSTNKVVPSYQNVGSNNSKPAPSRIFNPPSYNQNMSVAPKSVVKPQISASPLMSVAPQMSVQQNQNKVEPKVKPDFSLPTSRPIQNNLQQINPFNNIAVNRMDLERKRAQDESNFIKQRTALSNKQLMEALPIAQEQFGKFKANTEATIADLLAGGERQKGQTEDYYGDAQRQAAQTLRETQGQTQKTFANLGTLDSRGEGSFQQANENAMSDFNRYTQQTLRAKADKLSEIDATIRSAERDARATIAQEETKMNQLARDIQYAVANNNLQEAQELTAAYNQSQSYIYDIQDALAGAQYEYTLAQQDLENEIAKTQSFTPEFMATGQPTNQAEHEFFIKNYDNFNKAYGLNPSVSGKLTEKQMAYQSAGVIAKNALTKLNSGNVSTGLGNKFFGNIGETLGTNSPEQQAYRSDIANMRTAIQNALLGANMSPKEMEQIMAAIPQYSDAPSIARSKLQSLITNLPIMAGNFQQVAPTSGVDINELLAQFGG